MIPDLQRESLSVLSEIWALSPDVRLGQLVDFLGFLGEVHVNRGLATIEDDELLAVMYRHRSELLDRTQGSSIQASQSVSFHTSVSGSATSADITPASVTAHT